MNVLKKNFKEIVEAIKDPIFYRVLIFLALTGTIPSFGTFGYYFMLDVVKLSKFTIALLNVLGYVSLMLGSALFNSVFNKKEFSTLCIYNIMLGILFSPMNLLFAMRLNEAYGLPDMFVIIFGDIVGETLAMSF